MLDLTKDEVRSLRYKIRQMRGEVAHHRSMAAKKNAIINFRMEHEAHAKDLQMQIICLEKLVKMRHYKKLPLPDCCYNFKKVEKYINGIP